MPQSIEPTIRVHHCESRNQLKRSLISRNIPCLLLGENDESPREFTILDVLDKSLHIGMIGVASYGGGIRPEHLVKAGKIFIGYNQRVAIIELKSLDLFAEVDLLSIFWEFIRLPSFLGVVVLCESAVVALSDLGQILWRQDTDLVKTYQIHGSEMILTFEDSPACRIELTSGMNVLRDR